MNRLATALLLGVAAIIGTGLIQRSAAQGERASFSDDFDRGLCVGRCATSPWAIAQQIRGRVSAAPAPGRSGLALLAQAEAKVDVVAKADVVARLTPIGRGRLITISFDLRIPAGTPLNSLQLVDLECATCGESGNPGIRLYLRRGRLRVDRSKIGIEHAWTRDDAPMLAHDRWHRIVWQVRVAADQRGGTRVLLHGREVLAARGATAATLPRVGIDRVQIGITANSNPVPATAWFDNVRVELR